MSAKDRSHRLGIIETAMLRFREKNTKSASSRADARSSKDLAEQIAQAKGATRAARPHPPSVGVPLPWASGAQPEGKAGLLSLFRATPRRSLLLATHLISAATGAAVMWYLIGGPVPPHESTSPTASVPATALAPSIAGGSSPAPPAVAAKAPVDEQVRHLIEQWRQAWSRRDADAYLAFYSQQFVPANGLPRAAWAESRRKNFLSRSSISVRIHELRVHPVNDRQVEVTLIQDYVSDGYTELGQPKIFLLAGEGDDWRIVSERQGG